MEFNQVYLKTSKGLEEIQSRSYKLPAPLRRLLIMVDGRSTAAEMMSRLTMLGDVVAGLVELEAGGFIFNSSVAKSATPSAAAPVVELAGRDPNTLSGQPTFNLDAAKRGMQSALLNAMGSASEYWIDCVAAAATPELLRVEFETIHELLPRVLSPLLAEQTWRQMEPIVLSLERWLANRAQEVPPAPLPAAPSKPAAGTTPAHPEFNLDKAKGFIRFTLLGVMGPTAARRIERVEATTTPEALRVELDSIRDMLPKVLSKRQAEQAWRQLEPIMISLNMPRRNTWMYDDPAG